MARSEPAWVPPPRQGVAASRVGVGAQPFATLLDFLVARFPAVADWPARLARGDVLDAAGQPVAAPAPCRPGMLLWYWRSPPPEAAVPFDMPVLFQDEHLVVVDKPHFLSVTPGGRHLHETALLRLQRALGVTTLAPMHRLDRDTAGVLVFTVQPAARGAYQALLRTRCVQKVYEAVAPWRPELALPLVCRSRLVAQAGPAFMQMRVANAGDGPPNAETHVALIARLAGSVLDTHPAAGQAVGLGHYRLTPRTGQKHQLRAQMSALGLPILGDRLYPRLLPEPAPDLAPDYSRPLQLLARSLAFTDPFSGQPRSFTSQRQLQL